MKYYIKPEIEVVKFSVSDIITESGAASSYKISYGNPSDNTKVISVKKFSDIAGN